MYGMEAIPRTFFKMSTMLLAGRKAVYNCCRPLYFCTTERKIYSSLPYVPLNSPRICDFHILQRHCIQSRNILVPCGINSDYKVINYLSGNGAYSRRQFSNTQTLQGKTLGTRLIEAAPVKIQPYLQLTRLDSPTGTFLLLWPALWSICLGAEAGGWPSCFHVCIFTLGTFLMRSAGCTINDMWDRKIDSKVERTKQRPLASGRIDFTDALGFLALQLGCATLLLLQLDWFSILLGFSSMGLVVSYPLAKRYTNWPQLVLGLTFNWGALMGWSAVHGASDWFLVLPLYAAAVSWTLVYDTIYAHQDKKYDAKLGLKSTALLFGTSSKKWLSLFSCSMVGNLLLTGILNDQTWPFYASTGLVGLHLAAQIATLDTSKPENCAKRFRSNAFLGLILLLGLVTSNVLKEGVQL